MFDLLLFLLRIKKGILVGSKNLYFLTGKGQDLEKVRIFVYVYLFVACLKK